MNKILLLLALMSFNVLAAPININKVDAKTLADSVKGIGLKKANAIVKYRTKHGSFKSIDDLRNVKGIGEKTIKKIATATNLSKSKRKKQSSAKPKSTKKKKVEKKTKKNKSKKVAKNTKKKDKTSKKKTTKKSKAKKSKN
jgi:competence protein ComEA